MCLVSSIGEVAWWLIDQVILLVSGCNWNCCLITAQYNRDECRAMSMRVSRNNILEIISEILICTQSLTETHHLLPSPISQHEVCPDTLSGLVKLLIRCVVDLVLETWIGKLLLENLISVMNRQLICLCHPFWWRWWQWPLVVKLVCHPRCISMLYSVNCCIQLVSWLPSSGATMLNNRYCPDIKSFIDHAFRAFQVDEMVPCKVKLETGCKWVPFRYVICGLGWVGWRWMWEKVIAIVITRCSYK